MTSLARARKLNDGGDPLFVDTNPVYYPPRATAITAPQGKPQTEPA